MKKDNRRSFIKKGTLLSASVMCGGLLPSCDSIKKKPSNQIDVLIPDMKKTGKIFFDISLAQWSFHKALQADKMNHLDFANMARSLGISGIEYVNTFFKDKAEDSSYLTSMNQRASDVGVKQLLIMIDSEGNLGDLDKSKRKKAIENHLKWVHAAKSLGCHSIRVNARGEGSRQDVANAAVNGLGSLSEYAAKENINIIVENHGGFSSDGGWLSGVIKQVGLPNCGTLPDFGNFCIKRGDDNKCADMYDQYKGVEEMMPFAKAVSAKSHNFDADGNETETDYMKMMKIVKDHGYTGSVGIEYEGSVLDEEAGVIATRDLLIKVGKALS